MNNAARTVARPFLEIDPEEWDDVVATNLRGTYFGCRVAGIHMCERDAGQDHQPRLCRRAVGTKPDRVPTTRPRRPGIVAITRYAATAFAPHGVTVNAIAPGADRRAVGGGDAA